MPNLTKLQRAQRELDKANCEIERLNGLMENARRVIKDLNYNLENAHSENDELNLKLEAADEKGMSYVQKYNDIQAQLASSRVIIQALLLLIATNKK